MIKKKGGITLFTGIVMEKGSYIRKFQADKKYQLEIEADQVLKDIKKGDSIAVNGVCLTVVEFGANYFRADLMPETLNKTNLGELKSGSIVNLEASLKANSPIGGHFVSGHIDSTGRVKKISEQNNAKLIEIEVDQETEKYIAAKGSVALNGVSLTVVEIKNGILKVSLIPESWGETNLSLLKISNKINIETDMLGKYVYKFLAGADLNTDSVKKKTAKNKVTRDFLSENGFIS